MWHLACGVETVKEMAPRVLLQLPADYTAVCGCAQAGTCALHPMRWNECAAQCEIVPRDAAVGDERGCYCVCGRFFATAMLRRMHVADLSGSGTCHGAPPSERPAVAGAWILYDVKRRTIVRAGRCRFLAQGTELDHSTRAENDTMYFGRVDVQPCLRPATSLEYDSDSQAGLAKYSAIVQAGISASMLVRMGDTGSMRALKSWEARYPAPTTSRWSPAQHNVPATSDRQHETRVLLNMIVDAAAKRSATATTTQEVEGYALGVAYRRPSLPDPYFFSRSGLAVLGDVRSAAREAVGDTLLSALVRRPQTHCGRLAGLLVAGDISPAATALARAAMTPPAFAAAVRASMGRTMATAREMVRETRSKTYDHLRRVLSVGGRLDDTCPHCEVGAVDGYIHMRFQCSALHAQRRFIEAHIATHVCRSGTYFWFQPSLRAGYASGEMPCPIGNRLARGARPQPARRVRQGVRRQNSVGLTEVYASASPLARLTAVFSDERLAALTRCWEHGNCADEAAQAAAEVVADALAAAGEPSIRLVAQLPPPWRKWLARRFGLRAETAQTPLTFMADRETFPEPPGILPASVAQPRRERDDWWWQYEPLSVPHQWRCSVLLTLSDDGSADATQLLGPSGVLYKRIRATQHAGRTVVMALESARYGPEHFRHAGSGVRARTILTFPPGAIAVGTGAGWRARTKARDSKLRSTWALLTP